MDSASEAPVRWDPYNPQFFANPYPAFRRLREEAPIYYNAEHDFYAVSRYDDVSRCLGEWESFSSAHGDVMEMIKARVPIPRGSFIHEDPPLHTVYRRVMTRVFTPKRMAALEPQIREFCALSLDPLVEDGVFDFIANLGTEMPMRVISMLLGIPDEDQKAIQERVNSNLRTEPGKPIDFSTQTKMGEGFEGYIDWRMKHPSDDLMTELLSVEFEDETGTLRKLAREEILVIVNIVAGAGNETTNRLIGWTGKLLAEHPDQRRQIYENRALIPQAIEEILRYEPPGPSVARLVVRDSEFHGVKVPEGAVLLGLVAAGNRDERKFANGETFDINRERLAHLTFGYGFHNCLGNALARVEGRVALDELLNRFPEWDVDLEHAHLSSTSTVRGWETLPAYTPKGRNSAKRQQAAKPATTPAPQPLPEGTESWKLVMKTPMGPQEMTLHFVRGGNSFTGQMESPMGSEAIGDGKIDGNSLSWTMDVKKPMPIKLSFEVKTENGRLSGEAKLGVFGTAEVTGERVGG